MSVPGRPPVEVGFAFEPACLRSESRTRFDEEPGAENAMGHEAVIDNRGVPRPIYTDPEIASVGLTEPRIRALLLGVVGIYDLVDQMWQAAIEQPDSKSQCSNYATLRTQLLQLLAGNGLAAIAADGEFDPDLHFAVRHVPCADAAQANRVLQVVRQGFRTEQAVLRYAEVLVGRHEPAADAAAIGTSDAR